MTARHRPRRNPLRRPPRRNPLRRPRRRNPLRRLRSLPLRTRLALACGAAVAIVAAAGSLAAFAVVRLELGRQLDVQLGQQATFTAQQNKAVPPQVISGECTYLSAPACSQVVGADPADDPAHGFLLPVTDTTREVAAGHHDAYYSDISIDGHPARMYTVAFGRGQAVQVAERSDTVQHGIEQAAKLMAAVFAGGLILAVLLGYIVARTSLRPVVRLTRIAERIAATRDASLRIEVPPGADDRQRPDELVRLASSFNTMMIELEDSVTARRQLVADASHELRTPLTALRTNAELLTQADRLRPDQLARIGDRLGRQTREITGLVNDLIELARNEEPAALLETLRLDQLSAHRVETAREHWPELTFDARLEEPILVHGVAQRLARLVDNLLDNAAKYSPPAAAVRVSLTAHEGIAELTVRDHGPGISPEDLPHVFDRFYRSASARALPGSGLGLAMARLIAQSHGADLAAEAAPGGGALLRLRIATV
jgi:two-component system sensor histidine kinase MprB